MYTTVNITHSTPMSFSSCRKLFKVVAMKSSGSYAGLVNDRPTATLRDLFALKETGQSIDLDKVESVGEIVKRFDSAAMSLGALSPEAHEALAEAMNRLGGRSNSGEGGEDPSRFGTNRVSKIKQIASGSFWCNTALSGECRGVADQGGTGGQAG